MGPVLSPRRTGIQPRPPNRRCHTLHYRDDLRPDNQTLRRAVFYTNLSKMAEELGDEDLVDYEEDEVVDDKPADEVKK